MNEDPDQELGEWLRREFSGPVADDGFATQVMRLLPPRPRRRTWPLSAAVIVGALLAWLALAPSALGELAAREWLAADFGASSALLWLVLFGVGLLGCAWAIEEGA